MKNLILLSSLIYGAFFFSACNNENAGSEATADTTTTEQPASPQPMQPEGIAQPEVPAGPTTKMTFKYLEYDFGTVKDGEVVAHEYEFVNTGTEPLIISDAKASCGCTVPQWPKEPIQPGDKGKIKVEFDSKGKPGPQSKRVTITANTDPAPIYLTIKGNVEGKQ